MSKIIFLVQHLGQPRCIKRIIAVKDAGFEVEVHGFDRGNYSENISQLEEHGVPLKTVIRSKDLSQKQKLLSYAKLVRKVASSKAKDDVIYAFGFEMATFTRLLTRSKYIYECADVVAAREHSNLFLRLDKKNIAKAKFTVFTSEGFADYFWGDMRNTPAIKETYILQPNKLNAAFIKLERPAAKKIESGKIRFGFVGILRFFEIYLTFCELIGKDHSNYEFHFWGDADEADKKKVSDVAEKYPNVYYHGKYANPQDLNKVYDSFDVCVTVYNTSSGNVQIAEPNKLYESMYFGKPIIVSKGTFLGKKVEDLGVGMAIEPTFDGIKGFLDNLSVGNLNKMIDNECAIDKTELVDNSDALCKKLTSVLKA